MKVINQEPVTIGVDHLHEHPRNANLGDVDAIKESIEENGFYGYLVVQKGTNYVVAGNHRLRAARELGLGELPVCYVEVGEEEAVRLLTVDNRTTRLGADDEAQLLENLVLFSEGDFKGTGFNRSQFEDLVSRVGADAVDDDFEFEGDYALNQKAVDMQPDLLREGAAMREIVLALPKDEALVFGEQVLALMKFWKTTAVREVVQRAVRECYERLPQESAEAMQDATATDGGYYEAGDIEL